MITVSVVGGDRMTLDGVAAWARASPDLRLVATAGTVADLRDVEAEPADVVVLDLGPARAVDARTLLREGRRVVVVAGEAEVAGAPGVVPRSAGLDGLGSAIRSAAGGTGRPCAARPHLSDQERVVLLGYVSGMTLASAARQAGVRPDTAKKYLARVKRKYTECGRATYTKLDLARRAREDGLVD